jgi:hypothetical protein
VLTPTDAFAFVLRDASSLNNLVSDGQHRFWDGEPELRTRATTGHGTVPPKSRNELSPPHPRSSGFSGAYRGPEHMGTDDHENAVAARW